MVLSAKQYEGVRNWMLLHARPLDAARWKYHFEDGTRREVLDALRAFQNADGGFGHGLEADCWNPESSPLQTWTATEILLETGATDGKSGVIPAILRYLEACPYLRDGKWMGTIPSNDASPHAPWWSYSEEMVRTWNWNPTACLAGFILLHADKASAVYALAENVAQRAAEWFLNQPVMGSFHETFCFMRLAEYLKVSSAAGFDAGALEEHLKAQVSALITADASRWNTEYVCKPSFFIKSRESIFYEAHKALAEYEADSIVEAIGADGVWEPNWRWDAYPAEWETSRMWWKGDIAIKNMLYLRAMGRI